MSVVECHYVRFKLLVYLLQVVLGANLCQNVIIHMFNIVPISTFTQ